MAKTKVAKVESWGYSLWLRTTDDASGKTTTESQSGAAVGISPHALLKNGLTQQQLDALEKNKECVLFKVE